MPDIILVSVFFGSKEKVLGNIIFLGVELGFFTHGSLLMKEGTAMTAHRQCD
ncbi:hypothetical protein [Desulfovibrio piger]